MLLHIPYIERREAKRAGKRKCGEIDTLLLNEVHGLQCDLSYTALNVVCMYTNGAVSYHMFGQSKVHRCLSPSSSAACSGAEKNMSELTIHAGTVGHMCMQDQWTCLPQRTISDVCWLSAQRRSPCVVPRLDRGGSGSETQKRSLNHSTSSQTVVVEILEWRPRPTTAYLLLSQAVYGAA